MNNRGLVSVLILTWLLTGCEGNPVQQEISAADYGYEPNSDSTRQNAEKYILSTLLDPYSAVIQCGQPTKGWVNRAFKNSYGYLLKCTVNAKNKFGGYTGVTKSFFWIHDESMTILEPPFEFEAVP